MTSGYEALRTSAAWIDLTLRGTIRVSGEDRARLMHAMCTNHVLDLAAGDGLYAFFLNAQGRILADAYVYNLDETLILDTEPETATKLREHLDRYIIADDVTLEDETAQWAKIGLEGPDALKVAEKIGIPAPRARYCLRVFENGFVAKVASSGADGLRVFLPTSDKSSFLERLAQNDIPEVDQTDARVVRLELGKPRYGEDITDRYLVQETSDTDAVNFNKGCYLGQEIVERVRSRGQVHRFLTPVRIRTHQPPPAGTKLQVDGKDAAEITSAAFSPALHETVALAYVRGEAARQKPEMTVAGSEPTVTAYIS
ncbi:MAG: glycine cleavage T C-terminal barrel domain-containing protein [Bryobacteraceae bacterium]